MGNVSCNFCRHLQRRHVVVHRDYLREKPSSSVAQSSISDYVPSTSASEPHAGWSKSYDKQHPKQQLINESLIYNLIVMCGLPVSIIDNPHFRQFLHDLDAKYTPPCRQTVTNSYLPKLLSDAKAKLQTTLDNADYISLTADIWTDRRAHSFLGVTVHLFSFGKPESYLVAFRTFEGSHTGQRIADEMDTVMEDFNITNRTRFIVTDNASKMKKAMCILLGNDEVSASVDTYFGFDDPSVWEDHDDDALNVPEGCTRLPCFAHSLQLVIRDGLQNLTVCRGALAKTSKLANIVHQSSVFRTAFEATFGPGRAIPVTNSTRWNSVFHQLRSIMDLEHSKLADVLRDTNHDNLILSKKDIEQLNELVDLLAPFAEATDLCQGEQTVTISCVVPVVLSLNRLLTERKESTRHFSDLVNKLHRGTRT